LGVRAFRLEDHRRRRPVARATDEYYAAVQLLGSVRVDPDPAAVAAVLRRQLNNLKHETAVADQEVAHPAKLRLTHGVTCRSRMPGRSSSMEAMSMATTTRRWSNVYVNAVGPVTWQPPGRPRREVVELLPE